MSERKNTTNIKYKMLSALFIALSTVFVVFSFVAFSHAKYVTEIGGGDLPYEVQTPFDVKSQQELFNAIASGYGYVRLSDALDGPIIMTGNSLDLKSDLTIDLNGKEIQRNSRDSLLSVPEGTTFTVVDTAGGGRLYNPIGSVLTLSGGNINVYGGVFESGPRPSEYYGNLSASGNSLLAQDVLIEKCDLDPSLNNTKGDMPVLTLRESAVLRAKNTGNVYFDGKFAQGANGNACAVTVPEDTYCYMVTSGSDEMGAFDTSKTDFVYSYYVNSADGKYVGAEKPAEEGEYTQVKVFGYTKDIEKSLEQKDSSGNVISPAPYYSAVYMDGGILNVDVTATSDVADGSFYSYFGTWYSSCVYIKSGTMTVSTAGEFATVNPADLSSYVKTDGKEENSARYGEGACILAAGGVLDVQKIRSATSYNGSIISVSGGEVHIKDANLSKYATMSHANSPFDIADEVDKENGGASQFPANRQYRDAAIFINGGTLDIADSTVKVYKDIPAAEKNKSTFGILSRGRTDSSVSGLKGSGVQVLMHGSHSYGIFATRGTVELGASETRTTQSKIVVDSDNTCYGVYAVNKNGDPDRAVNVQLHGADIEVGPRTGQNASDPLTNYGTFDESTYVGSSPVDLDADYGSGTNVHKPASIGVYLECQPEFPYGKVEIHGANVSSKEVGVAVYGGELNFYNEGSINAYNASAIALRDGNIMFAENSSFDINCELNRIDNSVTASDGTETECGAYTTAAKWAGTHQYNLYMPWQDSRETKPVYENNNAIRIIGGNLEARGDSFNVNFRGLYNDFGDDVYKVAGDDVYFDNFVVKSFAVACDGGNVNIEKANIVTTVGGGVKVSGGTINLGNENTTRDDIVIETRGKAHGREVRYASAHNSDATWKFFDNLSGGYAVVARGGNITVWNGTYTASYCDAIAATNEAGSELSRIVVHNGVFTGKMEHIGDNYSANATSGPASHYGLKVMGGAEMNIYNGEFDGRNGGGIVRGRSAAAKDKATVKIYAGTFGKPVETEQNEGQDGFNIYEYSTVHFGAYTDAELNEHGYKTFADRQEALRVYGNLFPVAVNYLTPNDTKVAGNAGTVNNAARVYLYYGKYFIRRAYTWENRRFGIGAVNYPMRDVKFFIYGYGKNVFAQTRGNTWAVSRIRWNFANGSDIYNAGMGANDNTGSFNTFRATTKNEYYYNSALGDEQTMPTENLVLSEHVDNET